MNKLKRYLLFLAGLFVNALGVSLVTKASLGTSPISSIPYVLSLNYPLTLGNFTIIFSIFLILLQLLILRKNFKIENVLQIPVSIAFGYFIDLTFSRMCCTGLWCLYGSAGGCGHVAGRIFCPCDCTNLEHQFWNDEDHI